MGSDRIVSDVGEFGLIDRLASILGDTAAIVGIGDDAAVLDLGAPDYLLATTDSLVEAVHFRRGHEGPSTLGRRAVAVNVSDIAAMGGTPEYALASLVLPPDTEVRFVEDLYRGIRDEAAGYGLSVVGGNLARIAGPLVLGVTVLGRVRRDEVILRRGARVGDVLAVTGVLGGSAARLLEQTHGLVEQSDTGGVVPVARVQQARALAQAKLVHAMMDISDGLASDVRHLADASSVGAVLYQARLPVAISARRVSQALNLQPDELALSGGEDYELLMALAEDDLVEARTLCGSVPLTVVGTVLANDQGVVLETEGGVRTPLAVTGWQHF